MLSWSFQQQPFYGMLILGEHFYIESKISHDGPQSSRNLILTITSTHLIIIECLITQLYHYNNLKITLSKYNRNFCIAYATEFIF